jgi:hypothetical protein
MPNDYSDLRTERTARFPDLTTVRSERPESTEAGAAWWLSGGAMLLVWTALALLLTSA